MRTLLFLLQWGGSLPVLESPNFPFCLSEGVRSLVAGFTFHVSCSNTGTSSAQRSRWSCEEWEASAAVTPQEWKKRGLSEASLSLFYPCITPLLIITAEETRGKEEGRGQRRLLHNMLSIKSTQADWDLDGCGGRLGGGGEQGKISTVYPALPVCLFLSFTWAYPQPDGIHPLIPHTHKHAHTQTRTDSLCWHVSHNQELGFLDPIIKTL